MAASAQQTLDNIERRRVQLQESVDKLRRALTHWTTWEAEYHALKEELEGAHDPSPAEMRDMARALELTLLDDQEVEALLGATLQTKRTANQVVDMVARRIDYVQQNSATVEKQLDAAEKQLAGVDVLLEPGVDNEEGLPMMDIEEELDEDGNAISTSVNQTGKGAAELVEVLRKAGEKNPQLAKLMGIKQQEESQDTSQDTKSQDTASQGTPSQDATLQEAAPQDATRPTSSTEPAAPKKSVSFAETVDIEPSVDAKPPKKAKGTLETDGYNEDLADFNFTSGTKVIELNSDEEELASYPIIPQGESPEDAELRRQMLQYGLSEVGQIVAELDLDNPVAEYSDEEYDEDDYDEDEDEEEDEDEYGRSTKPAVSEDYRKQMAELEKKLNARMLENVGPRPETDELEEQAEAVRTLKVQKDDEFDAALAGAKSTDSQAGSKKKGVRFADDVDISEAPQPAQPTQAKSAAAPPSAKPAPTMSDVVVERQAGPAQPPQPPTVPKPGKVSRFKSARAAGEQPRQMMASPPVVEAAATPTGPAGRTLADTIVEQSAAPSEPSAPDDFDPIEHQREIQVAYHTARNKFMQQQGKFKPSEEDDERPIMEERNGKTKRVSRFMAAKLKAEGM
jgi:unconventional prefoldin RPB5 interactor 1